MRESPPACIGITRTVLKHLGQVLYNGSTELRSRHGCGIVVRKVISANDSINFDRLTSTKCSVQCDALEERCTERDVAQNVKCCELAIGFQWKFHFPDQIKFEV